MAKAYDGWKFIKEEDGEFPFEQFIRIMNARFDFGCPGATRPAGPDPICKPDVPAVFNPFSYVANGKSDQLYFMGKLIFDSENEDYYDTDEEWMAVLKPRVEYLLSFAHTVQITELF